MQNVDTNLLFLYTWNIFIFLCSYISTYSDIFMKLYFHDMVSWKGKTSRISRKSEFISYIIHTIPYHTIYYISYIIYHITSHIISYIISYTSYHIHHIIKFTWDISLRNMPHLNVMVQYLWRMWRFYQMFTYRYSSSSKNYLQVDSKIYLVDSIF